MTFWYFWIVFEKCQPSFIDWHEKQANLLYVSGVIRMINQKPNFGFDFSVLGFRISSFELRVLLGIHKCIQNFNFFLYSIFMAVCILTSFLWIVELSGFGSSWCTIDLLLKSRVPFSHFIWNKIFSFFCNYGKSVAITA